MSQLSPRLSSNRGGGCVDQFGVTPVPPGHHLLRVVGPQGALVQVKLNDPTYADHGGSDLLGVGTGARPSTIELLEVLRDVLTVPCEHSVDYAIAVDWTMTPQEGVDSHSWPRTPIYDLVNRGKYQYRSPAAAQQQSQVGRAAAEWLCRVIERHPLLRNVDVVAAVPGHDARLLSFGARLAATVAAIRGIRFVPCASRSQYRAQAKDLDASNRAAVISNQFVYGENLTGLRTLIVDDVYHSGATVAEAARAIRAAGAVSVAALTPARTLRLS